jgi:hypothetical protein
MMRSPATHVMNTTTCLGAAILLLAGPLLAVCSTGTAAPDHDGAIAAAAAIGPGRTVPVSGSAVHFLSSAIVHSESPTDNGMIRRSSEIIRLTGDLSGYILYHPVTAIDFATNTLENTGTQFFSGTIAGSEPVVLHDATFRFHVDLSTGETIGKVHLSRSGDAPHRGWYDCDLDIVGTGLTPDGDATVDYSGECVRRGNLDR